MNTLEDLGDAITGALASNPTSDVLGVLCGSLVGLVHEVTRRSGNDPEKTITLDAGPAQRKIEIHARETRPNIPAAQPEGTGAEPVAPQVQPWQKCREHGPTQPNVWACPTCLTELRSENKRLKERDASWYGFAAAVAENLECLASAAPSGNGHIIRKLNELSKRAT